VVLFQHNVESALWRRQADHERNPLKRPIYRIEALAGTEGSWEIAAEVSNRGAVYARSAATVSA
jgi:hypothetical protein